MSNKNEKNNTGNCSDIDRAVAKAVKMIAESAEAATLAIANAAAESARIASQNTGDHDLLIELRTLMRVMQSTITEMKTGNSAQTLNHEERLSKVEKKVSNNFITTGIYTATTIALISLMVNHMITN